MEHACNPNVLGGEGRRQRYEDSRGRKLETVLEKKKILKAK
jgi:hypothetical protein